MWSTTCPFDSTPSHTQFLRHHARRLLRAVHGDMTRALPVLRRIVAAGVIPAHSLTALYAARTEVRLKHVFSMLATELGYADWHTCKNDIDGRDPAVLDAYRFEAAPPGDFTLNWFPDEPTARAWQAQHGGYVVRYGRQAVALLRA
ncbi:hypothetical protein [Trinickia fusca]|uniref:Uncharacterized protein n=1 Tax=Trinickia fusca TaxID=2419777 RepID=A0A494XQ85_9BURK|nr:hypothetical protein [Trinickia fusca]RKP52800.1 hypothetical protein D7S89_01360 [Trinickia fusca]